MRTSRQSAALALWLLLSTPPALAGPLEDGQAAYDIDDYATAIALWRPLAEQGDAIAQYRLSRMYRNGLGVAVDDAEALKWAQRALDGGNIDANNIIGVLYSIGSAVPKDDAKAAALFRLAAENGLDKAQVNLAGMYYEGTGVAQSDEEAFGWFLRAAKQGQPIGQFWVAKMYGVGEGIAQNIAESAKWYCWQSGVPLTTPQTHVTYDPEPDAGQRNAAALACFQQASQQDFYSADLILADLYEHGLGVPLDKSKAAAHYRLAAEGNWTEAQYHLAQMYRQGDGVPQDDAEAANWFQIAANYGDAKAQAMLGVIYAEGRGVSQNYVLATVWLNQGFANASDAETKRLADQTRNKISAKMNADERAFAARLTTAALSP
jgi:TPR repeat protein